MRVDVAMIVDVVDVVDVVGNSKDCGWSGIRGICDFEVLRD